MRTPMEREAFRRQTAKRHNVVQTSPNQFVVTQKKNSDYSFTVTQTEQGMSCTCDAFDKTRCRHIVTVEMFLGIYKNPYYAEWAQRMGEEKVIQIEKAEKRAAKRQRQRERKAQEPVTVAPVAEITQPSKSKKQNDKLALALAIMAEVAAKREKANVK